MSTTAEWHAFTHGFYAGLRTLRPRAVELPDNEDVQKEPHYFKGGFIIATFVQLGLVLFASYAGVAI